MFFLQNFYSLLFRTLSLRDPHMLPDPNRFSSYLQGVPVTNSRISFLYASPRRTPWQPGKSLCRYFPPPSTPTADPLTRCRTGPYSSCTGSVVSLCWTLPASSRGRFWQMTESSYIWASFVLSKPFVNWTVIQKKYIHYFLKSLSRLKLTWRFPLVIFKHLANKSLPFLDGNRKLECWIISLPYGWNAETFSLQQHHTHSEWAKNVMWRVSKGAIADLLWIQF